MHQQHHTVSEIAELLSDTLQDGAAGRVPDRIAGKEFEVGSIIQADLDRDSSDIEIEINRHVYRLLVTDITSEVLAHRAAREVRS